MADKYPGYESYSEYGSPKAIDAGVPKKRMAFDEKADKRNTSHGMSKPVKGAVKGKNPHIKLRDDDGFGSGF